MRNIALIGLAIFLTFQVNAQKKSEIIQAGIEVQRTFSQDLSNGASTPSLEKEEFFNIKGELIEIKDYADNGKTIKSWFKYKYDTDGNVIEELELDAKGAQKEKVTYKFDHGFKQEKLTYDAKNRLTKKKTYEYGIRK